MDEDTDRLAKILWDYNQLHQKPVQSDAIVALGSMDTRVAERAAELWHQAIAPLVVVSGGFGRLTAQGAQGATISEAEQFKQVLLRKAVPETCILIEDASTNTAENFRFTMALLAARNIPHSKLTVVTKPYMERRAYATFRKLFPGVGITMSSPQIAYEAYPNERISKELMINILVGDTQRLQLYAGKGFTIPQEMPAAVSAAMQSLIQKGYDHQLASL